MELHLDTHTVGWECMICSSAWHSNYIASGAPSKAHRDPVTVVMEQYVEAESRLPPNRFSLV
jgi:hypothetical protein